MRVRKSSGWLLLVGMVLVASFSSSVVAQDPEPPRYHSRSELKAARQNVRQNFPEEIRALRTLHLPPEKVVEVEMKLRRFETATKGAREELHGLLQQQEKQGYNRRSDSERVNELRTNLEQARDQLHSEIKTLLTKQQREQFERHLQKAHHNPTADRRNR